jgi:NitT/TauT family transport system substrate-binding protein
MHVSRRTLLSLMACTPLMSLLASCDSGTTGSTNSMTLKVGQVTNALPFFPFYVAIQQSFFKAQGLTLDPPIPPLLNSGSKLAEAVEANSLEIGIGGITDAFTISRVDDRIKIIGAISDDFLIDIVVSKKLEQQTHLTATSSLVEKIHGLVGKKIGISAPNSASDALVTYLFRQQHLDSQKDAVKVNLGADNATLLAALQAGRVDAVTVAAPAGEQAEKRGFGDIFISPVRGDVPSMIGQLFIVSYIKQSVINTKPQAVRAFIRALAQAEEYIQKNPSQTIQLLSRYLKVDKTTATTVWNATKASMPQTPQVSQRAYENANQFHVDAGLIAVPLAYSDLVATSTINNALSG